MSLREYEAYLLYVRTTSDSLILRAGRLTQQYCVDQWAKLEQARLRFIENNQLQYRLETLQGLADALRNESVEVHRVAADEEVRQRRASTRQASRSEDQLSQIEAAEIGHKIIISPSFTGEPRYMYQRFSDAMATVRETRAPSLFITMTYNPNWPEIKENLFRRGQKASDRPDIVARVFMQKLKELNKDLDEGVFGIQAARVHVVEYQKRGLPHAHILLILRPVDKPVSAEDVDNLVWAELPDKDKYPELYETVISSMMYGSCGEQNPRSPCMKNGRCSKKFPKPFSEETTMSEDKYAAYRRPRRPRGRPRPSGFFSHKGKVWNNATVNQWVVPYNPFLSQKYNCHVNVEICATSKAIKYIYKYVYNGRNISPVEACNRIFMHPIQGATHSVVNLPIHLEDMNMVAYRGLASTTQLYNIIHRGSRSNLTECLGYAPDILMQPRDVPTKYTWDNKKWKPYKKYLPSIG
ncbi:Helitron helicase [Phytophthora megakarya]|uniref:Helitron helicase n=1 Tax=Phytophthora megakarya TaxID=4795 RepID=A0A225UW03_9STRA|nr:Helitron helicase [Phytophthora megakarya]